MPDSAPRRAGLRAALRDTGVAGSVSGLASFAAIVLGDLPVRTYRDLVATRVHAGRLAALHHALLNRGVIASPQLGFTLSTPMGEDEIDVTVAETRAALAGL
jgi:glutamate-1-semialdehyde aminotransferase